MEAAGTWALLLLLLLLLLLMLPLVLPKTGSRGHLPPGPAPLPLLGSLLQLRPGALYSGLLRLSKKHGPVFTVRLGPWRRVVVLVGHQAVREALGGQAEEFSGRGMLATLDRTFDGHGSEVRALQELSKKHGPVFTVRLGPWRRVVVLVGHQAVREALGGQAEEFSGRGMLATLDRTFDGHGSSRSCNEEEQNPNTEFTDKNLLMTVIYLLFAGTVTVSATARYTLLLLLKYPRVQERMREELTRELGPGRAPGLQDRARLPYTNAVLHEAQRLLALVPMGIPRALTRTTRFRGYTLPQGTEVFPLLGSVLHDPEVFEQPEEFNPDRFLDADGGFKKQEAFLPFSLGKRVCLGEGLARAELFLLITAILQAFFLESPCPPRSLSLQPAVSGLFNI
ncbi:cytochrome P450 2S1, partial [Pteropus vampyrus]|uniref:Cytochrome P450 2S1 n=1 Tax=Pteropus vampyrus TaxID=132908 RepID=A0A6P3RIC2_PTEVA